MIIDESGWRSDRSPIPIPIGINTESKVR